MMDFSGVRACVRVRVHVRTSSFEIPDFQTLRKSCLKFQFGNSSFFGVPKIQVENPASKSSFFVFAKILCNNPEFLHLRKSRLEIQFFGISENPDRNSRLALATVRCVVVLA